MKIVIININKKVYDRKFFLNLKKSYKNHQFISLSEKEFKISLEKFKDIDALINFSAKLFDELETSKLRKLKWIHTGSAGVESFMTEEFKRSKVILTNGKILQGTEIADHAIGLVLTFSRNIHLHIKKLKIEEINRPIELYKKKCAIVGLGGIGLCTAERLKTFGMDIDGYNNELIPMVSFVDNLFPLRNFYQKANDYDVIINSLPLTSKTKKFFNEKTFKKMKKNSIFINVSRGKVIEMKSLENKNLIKKFRGIGLDVTDPEPLPKKSILNSSSNVILTNHSSGLSDKNRIRSKLLVEENIKRFIYKESLLNIVDKNKEY